MDKKVKTNTYTYTGQRRDVLNFYCWLAEPTVKISRKFTVTLILQKFRESNVFAKENTIELIWHNFFEWRQ